MALNGQCDWPIQFTSNSSLNSLQTLPRSGSRRAKSPFWRQLPTCLSAVRLSANMVCTFSRHRNHPTWKWRIDCTSLHRATIECNYFNCRGRSWLGFAAKAETRDWFRPHPAKPNSFAKLSVSVSHPARPRLDAETTSLASISIESTYVDYRSMILIRTCYRTLRYIVVHT